jgi:hypothetical protein
MLRRGSNIVDISDAASAYLRRATRYQLESGGA